LTHQQPVRTLENLFYTALSQTTFHRALEAEHSPSRNQLHFKKTHHISLSLSLMYQFEDIFE
jgi:hypothetical protein